MLTSILLTSLGFVFAYRILATSLRRIGFLNHLPRIFLVLTGFMLIFFTFRRMHPVQLWFFFGTIVVFIKSLPYFFSRYLEILIQRHTLRMLDHLVLGVQSGLSLRSSLIALSAQESSLLRVPWHNLVHAIMYEGSSAGLGSVALKKLYDEINRIEKSQSKCADQLRALRKQIKTMQDFRRKSGQVSMQIRMQAMVSAVLYVALLLFMISQFGFFANRGLILVSSVLFFAGLVTVFVIGRRTRWNT